jgi:3'-phosphoadenosine 5'-phosphosulfate (PAPS) 3'-phosphatase
MCAVQLLGMLADPIRMDGQGKYGLIARGDAHLFMRLPRNNYQVGV